VKRGAPLRLAPVLRNRVPFVLSLLALAAAAGLPFVLVAPNRLVSGTGTMLADLPGGAGWLPAAPWAVLVASALLRPSRGSRLAVACAAATALAMLAALAGAEAARQGGELSPLARVSLGGGCWLLFLFAWLAAADALQGLDLGPVARLLAHAAVLLPLLGLLFHGDLDSLALLKEYANRREAFHGAWARHLAIVLATLAPALLLGLPLGVAAARSDRLAAVLFAVLNVIQTVPSIALFGLLIGPLAWLGNRFPDSGIRGIGLLPAVIALTLYALLPIVHGAASGLRQVPSGVIDAARGMGMTRGQLFWRVEAPLALPVLLSGVRVTAVQVVGLAVVAALVGAGGFGALVFQGLAGSALDLVVLGVLPVVALALALDAGLRALAARIGAGS